MNENDIVVDNDFDHQTYAQEEDETARTGRWGNNSSESDGVGLGPGVDTVNENDYPSDDMHFIEEKDLEEDDATSSQGSDSMLDENLNSTLGSEFLSLFA